MSTKTGHGASGHSKKHTTTAKHTTHKAAKHNPRGSKAGHHVTRTAKAKTTGTHHKTARGLAIGDSVACCAVEALAASLRLSGPPVSDRDVLALFGAAGGDESAGAPILATLDAASRYGLAGHRPRFGEIPVDWHIFTANAGPLLLGVDLPGAHAVWATRNGWWSWGELYGCWLCEWPDAVIEEAWAVTWR